MPGLLQINNLTTRFSSEGVENIAVNSISFSLNRGETVGIVGESGSGKSVTSLSVMRLISSPPGKITSGEILYTNRNGETINLLALPEKAMRKYRGNEIAMIFQEPMTSLNPVFTCGMQVMEALQLHKKLDKKSAKAQTLELFRKVELPRPEAIFNSYPHQVSGGQKQRVMIAMAMSCDPAILIADEPTTALDVTVQATILGLMKQLQQENDMGILFITHDLGVIAELAQRVIVMYKGNIVEQGPVQEIFKNPRHPYTKGLLACRPPLTHKLRILPTVKDFMKESDGNLVETGLSIKEVTGKYIIPEADILSRREKLRTGEPLLKVESLATWFPVKRGIFSITRDYVKAVDDVSFEVFRGETVGLVGESGCGKTTLGRSILRLIEPTGGKVWYKGQELTALSRASMREMRRHIQIIFQDPYSSLNPRITVGEAILEPMQVHGVLENTTRRKERVMELLERVNLSPGHYSRYPHEFSGGQRQRICIARALALNPEFIICDESVSALDVSVQAQVLNLLNELRDQFGFTYIFISHDLSVVKFMSDRMLVMNKGKVEETGYPEQIYANPQKEYTRKLISAIPKGL